MSVLRLFSLYDCAVNAYLKPFVSDHRGNAIRAFIQLLNDKSNPENMIAAHPDQFVLFELGEFDPVSGLITSLHSPSSLGVGTEFLKPVLS